MMGKDHLDCFRELGPSNRSLNTSCQVGISSLPDQFVNLQVKKGFTFNIMCIGPTGIGKTTLLHSLFRLPFPDEGQTSRLEEIQLTNKTLELKEANVNLRTTFIETKGFGDQINKSISVDNITKYINDQFEHYLNEETKIKRSFDVMLDNRVHACLYMISPTGRCLSSLDVYVMKELHNKVNLIPIIGKSDILTQQELKDFKLRILSDLAEHKINIYQAPIDDPILAEKNTLMNNIMPFAVIASTDEELINNQLCRIRRYPWGVICVDDDTHCEFSHLREMLLRCNLYDLMRKTNSQFYENYRSNRFQTYNDDDKGENINENIKQKRLEATNIYDQQVNKLRLKFDNDIKELERSFKLSELEMSARYETTLRELEQRRQGFMSLSSSSSVANFRKNNAMTIRCSSVVKELKKFATLRKNSRISHDLSDTNRDE